MIAIVITCDNCAFGARYAFGTAISTALREGWEMGGANEYCPDCARKREPRGNATPATTNTERSI